MRRREFLEVLASALGARAAASAWTGLSPTTGGEGFRAWVWLHGNNAPNVADWRARFTRLRRAGITSVLVEGGNTARLSAAARAEGLAFHRWIFMMYRSGDTWAKRSHPEWFSVSRNGDSSLTKPPYVPSYNWFCPSREPVREYLRGIVQRAAMQPGVAGVHLDYIRFIDVILPRGLWARYHLVQDREFPEYDFCYCDVCRAKFQAQSGVDPLRLPDPSADQAWRAFRWNAITELVTELSRTVHGQGKTISAAVFATPSIARRLVRQAWDTWPVDAVFPMLYHNFYEEDARWIGRAAREGVVAVNARMPLYAGLFVPRLSPSELSQAVSDVREAGAAGVSLFSIKSLTRAKLEALRPVLAHG